MRSPGERVVEPDRRGSLPRWCCWSSTRRCSSTPSSRWFRARRRSDRLGQLLAGAIPLGLVRSGRDHALRNTGTVALVAVGTATLLAIAFALYTDREGAIGRHSLELTIYLPFLLPPIVTGLSLLVACAELGVSRGVATIVLGHTVFVLAITYRLVRTRLQSLPRSLVEASADLGATNFQTFRHIVLPQLVSAIVTGALLALTLSFDETLDHGLPERRPDDAAAAALGDDAGRVHSGHQRPGHRCPRRLHRPRGRRRDAHEACGDRLDQYQFLVNTSAIMPGIRSATRGRGCET